MCFIYGGFILLFFLAGTIILFNAQQYDRKVIYETMNLWATCVYFERETAKKPEIRIARKAGVG